MDFGGGANHLGTWAETKMSQLQTDARRMPGGCQTDASLAKNVELDRTVLFGMLNESIT